MPRSTKDELTEILKEAWNAHLSFDEILHKLAPGCIESKIPLQEVTIDGLFQTDLKLNLFYLMLKRRDVKAIATLVDHENDYIRIPRNFNPQRTIELIGAWSHNDNPEQGCAHANDCYIDILSILLDPTAPNHFTIDKGMLIASEFIPNAILHGASTLLVMLIRDLRFNPVEIFEPFDDLKYCTIATRYNHILQAVSVYGDIKGERFRPNNTNQNSNSSNSASNSNSSPLAEVRKRVIYDHLPGVSKRKITSLGISNTNSALAGENHIQSTRQASTSRKIIVTLAQQHTIVLHNGSIQHSSRSMIQAETAQASTSNLGTMRIINNTRS